MAEYHIFVNGTIFTSDDDNPWAQAMIVRGGRIFWVGREESLPPCRGDVGSDDLLRPEDLILYNAAHNGSGHVSCSDKS